MEIKRLVFFFIMVVMVSCSPYNGGGELIGTRKVKKWFEPRPYGMVLIPTGSLNIGQNDEDVAWSMTASQKTVSIPAFWMDETEITNDEYRQFVNWVIDSIMRQRLVDEGHEEFLMKDRKGEILDPPVLDKRIRIDFRKNEEYKEILEALEYQGDDRIAKGELDVRKLIYKYSWYDFNQAAANDRYYDLESGTYKGGTVINVKGEKEKVKGRSSFIMKKEVKIYPDTLCWIKDFTYMYNEPFVKEYFSHIGYDNYPVVGINWHQAQAFASGERNCSIRHLLRGYSPGVYRRKRSGNMQPGAVCLARNILGEVPTPGLGKVALWLTSSRCGGIILGMEEPIPFLSAITSLMATACMIWPEMWQNGRQRPMRNRPMLLRTI